MSLDPKLLPDIDSLRRRSQALAMLDAIMSPAWENRYYSFNAMWSDEEAMGSMRNGNGDNWFILFGNFGTGIKGLAHETLIARNKILANEVQIQVPQTFSSFLSEPAFEMDWLSYCYWRTPEAPSWQKVTHPNSALTQSTDGSENLALLYKPASSYKAFAEWYYEQKLPLASIESVYRHSPLTESLVKSLNPELDLTQAIEAAAEIGYPSE